MMDWIKVIVCITLFCLALGFGLTPNSMAEEQPKLLVYYFSFEVRIVLTDIECPDNQGWRAVAQRIDKKTIPGCWVQDPTNPANVRLNWNNGDFAVFEMEKFNPFTE